LHDDICKYAERDKRVILYEKFIPDSELIELHSFTNLCVYPYSDIVNSGSIINSLSLGCRVLAPRNKYLSELSKNLSEKNLFLYDDQFSAKYIERFLNKNNKRFSNPRKNLASYEWEISSALSKDFIYHLLNK